jgi:hypothetical protein
VERLKGRIVVVQRRHLLGGHHRGRQVALGLGVLQRSRPLLPLEQQLDPAQAALDLPDPRHHTHRIQDLGVGLVGVVLLGHGEHQPVALQGRLDGA